MDKLRTLKEFEKTAFAERLGGRETRLYLLLLANCGENGSGQIACDTVKDALGKGFSPAGLGRACRRLAALGLIERIFPLPDGMSGEDCILAYRILPPAEEQGHSRR
ncbi:MAG TPA: hypothetical protein VI298_14405 [Geobacteraceae bacterium]